jgi:hypothetical protein
MAEPFVSATPPNAAPAAAPVAHVDAKVMDQKEPAANKRKSNWEEIRGGKGSDASWKQGRGWARDDRQQFEKPHPVRCFPSYLGSKLSKILSCFIVHIIFSWLTHIRFIFLNLGFFRCRRARKD